MNFYTQQIILNALKIVSLLETLSRRCVEKAIDCVRDLCWSIPDILLRVFCEQNVGVPLVKAVILWTNVLFVVTFQTFT